MTITKEERERIRDTVKPPDFRARLLDALEAAEKERDEARAEARADAEILDVTLFERDEARAALKEACGLLRKWRSGDGLIPRGTTSDFLAKHDPEGT